MGLRDWPLPGPDSILMDAHEVAKFLGVHIDTLRGWIKRGVFPAGQMKGGEASWTGADIAAYIQLRGRLSGNEGEPGPGTDG